MKKIIILAAVAFVGCKKEYSCVCSRPAGGYSENIQWKATTKYVPELTKKCKDVQMSIAVAIHDTSYTCHLH